VMKAEEEGREAVRRAGQEALEASLARQAATDESRSEEASAALQRAQGQCPVKVKAKGRWRCS
jgi:hypothetical protein